MQANTLEEQAQEYLRLNGFFLISNFVLHFDRGQAKEIDILGVRLKGSVERVMGTDGNFTPLILVDDEILGLGDNSMDIIVIAEATESTNKGEVKKRLDYLRDIMRLKYAFQRFGFTSDQSITDLASGRIEGKRLVKIMFVLNDELKNALFEEYRDILILPLPRLVEFRKSRAVIDIKQRARRLLPRYLHDEINNGCWR